MKAHASKDQGCIAITSGNILIKAGKANNNRGTLIQAANIIIDVAKNIQRAYNHDFKNEDTYIHQFLSPWINNVFYGEQFEVK
jgi:hypothetical protein